MSVKNLIVAVICLFVFNPSTHSLQAKENMQKFSFADHAEFRSFLLSKVNNAQNEIQLVSEACSDKKWFRRLKKAKRRDVKVSVLRSTSCKYLKKYKIARHEKPALKVFSAPLILLVDGELFYASRDLVSKDLINQLTKKPIIVRAPPRLWESFKEQYALATDRDAAISASVAPPVYRSGLYQPGTPALGQKMVIPSNRETVVRSSPQGGYDYDRGKPQYVAPQNIRRSLPKQPVYRKLGRNR